ncbi:6-phosphofructokinase [Roseibacillus ishigakijimensis]|uniref:6-phosphofructokinase n=1 Tax=Roseibacillus ishigakijimensis TaxID=454146 RepID=A0A934RKQ2_9BACT|nr:6-phosphofructokinase [Roseibacillus ishigakijimensis]MBK1832510.1 6-phosphofructokinase [Roseibacillus ishigakijimensis]
MSERVAIMTSGGDSAGMNPAIKCATDYARAHGMEPYLVYDGLRGLIDDKIKKAEAEDVSGILHRGGTILRSSRSKRFFDYKMREVAYNNLKEKGIGKMVVIGGDGSFNALHQFHSDFDIPFAGIPATIDNDIPGTDYCLGVDTALNVILNSIDSIRDTATSFSRAFVIEVMGRHCGYLAMVSALACGAEICLVPEIEYDLDCIHERLRMEKEGGRTYLIAIVAEGVKMGDYLTRWINDSLKMDTRLTVLGHTQRGGSPTVRDRVMAYQFATGAIDSLQRGETSRIMTYQDGVYSTTSVQEVTEGKSIISDKILNLCKPLCS